MGRRAFVLFSFLFLGESGPIFKGHTLFSHYKWLLSPGLGGCDKYLSSVRGRDFSYFGIREMERFFFSSR